MTKDIIKVLAFDGCEDIELFAFVDIITRADFTVEIIAPFDRKFITTKSGVRIDYNGGYAKFGYLGLDGDYGDEHISGIYVPGGAIEDDFNKFMKEYGNYFNEQIAEFANDTAGFIIANCIAPALLAQSGTFDFNPVYKITCYPGAQEGRFDKKHLVDNTEIINGACRNGQIVTGNGPSATMGVAFGLVAEIRGTKLADKLKSDMGFLE